MTSWSANNLSENRASSLSHLRNLFPVWYKSTLKDRLLFYMNYHYNINCECHQLSFKCLFLDNKIFMRKYSKLFSFTSSNRSLNQYIIVPLNNRGNKSSKWALQDHLYMVLHRHFELISSFFAHKVLMDIALLWLCYCLTK